MNIKLTVITLAVFACIALASEAKKTEVIEVSYANFENGNTLREITTVLTYAEEVVALDASTNQIQSFIDFRNQKNVDFIRYADSFYKLTTPFDSLPKPSLNPDSENILGFECRKATFNSFSNTIEVWFTEDASAKGSPYKNYLPTAASLVLKVLINGNYGLIATKIQKSRKANLPTFPSADAKEITSAEFEELKIKSRYQSVVVFKDEQINFDGNLETPQGNLKANKTYRFSKGTVILKKIALPKIVKDGAYVYVKLTCSSLGDAYDRTGSVFMLPVNADKQSMIGALQFGVENLPVLRDNSGTEYHGFTSDSTYVVPTEVMRFFTSFGVNYFNNRRPINNYNWENEVVYKQEITALIPDKVDSIWVGVFIGNYSKDGHEVSLEFDYYPGSGASESTQKFIAPLFMTVNIMEMSGQNYPKLFENDTLEVVFEIPKNTQNLQLLFTTTGHGGWGGGDEFNPKLNEVFIDEELVYGVVPWRTDCATYRLLNPASGNFSNGMSSSDLSRSNWCPATLTPPYIVPLKGLAAGRHKIKIAIDQGKNEGGSFSHWGVSGVLVGEVKMSE